TSSKTTSGRSERTAETADAPSSASPTTSNPAASSSLRANRRKLEWSSTISTVGMAAIVPKLASPSVLDFPDLRTFSGKFLTTAYACPPTVGVTTEQERGGHDDRSSRLARRRRGGTRFSAVDRRRPLRSRRPRRGPRGVRAWLRSVFRRTPLQSASVQAETRYTRSGDVNIAYQVVGEGPYDVVFVPGYATHLELAWRWQAFAPFIVRLASFCRLIRLDKRGTGMSDAVVGAPTLETRMDDVR